MAEIGPELRGLVLDLRGNPGGLLDQAVAVSDLFLDDGRVVSTHGRHPDSHQYFEAGPGDVAAGKPIIVLINGNSASAAEIVAAALQDDGRAVVVGTNSYGKGTVQTVIRMPNDGELTQIGLLGQAVAVSDLFPDGGRVVSTHGRHPDSHQYFGAGPGDGAAGKPIIVLINGNSASAAEIVAAALQDDGRAVVVGTNSYGKGTVQTVIRMPNDGELT